jgi:sodium-dependent dicarboxylate transporter 2/3/5
MKQIGLVLGPFLFLTLNLLDPAFGLSPDAWKLVSIALWMVAWWMTEAVALPVTAFLPMVLFPLLGLANMASATAPYADPIIFLFMGGFLIALAMQKRNLHQRIALFLIQLVGTNPAGIVIGFMLATAFLSMWISNTATAVMMLPIALSVTQLISSQLAEVGTKPMRNFSLVLMLMIAYAANIGGTATIIGTPPNVVFVGYMEQFYDYEVRFNQYLLVGIPVMVLMLALTYVVLAKWLFPFSGLQARDVATEVIRQKQKELGDWSKAEVMVGLVFTCTALTWIFRGPINDLLPTPILNDTLIAMAGGLTMFVLPVKLSNAEFVLDWRDTKELPWGILMLFGGGLALAKGMENSGLIQVIGEAVASRSAWSAWLLMLALSTLMLFMTELMSNVALCVIFLPVVIGISMSLDIPPMMMTLPVTLASSYAFMMPVSTPPNAIVYSSGYIPIRDMIRAGFILNLIAIVVLLLISQTLVPLVYG